MNKRRVLVLSFILIIILSVTVGAVSIDKDNRGKEVREVQKLLKELGYNINIDGIYGYRTKSVVKDFQHNNGLNVDGIVGRNTLKLLKETAEDIKYTVKKGDTLSEIAVKYDTTVEDIKDRNKMNKSKIIIGQDLFIPKTGRGGGEESKIYSAIIHEVQRGDALSIIARKYGSDVQTIKLANNLHSNTIYVDQNLVIPHLSKGAQQRFKLARGSLIWPVMGRISSSYGWRIHPISNEREFHKGVDIAVPNGSKIRAVAGGRVIQSGWINGFGKTIVIDHGQGIKTLYGHNSRIMVSAGRRIKIGQVIALAGSTGASTGSHLHFGLFVKGKSVNPAKYLP